ncbi:hypothetical protein NQ317_003870 [Molorchus minor]|uniref:Uncharacterized protein n=1 Tax=Molorchus minor TaxID=1323400 RepID=A0ABQ9JU46_9CUCU|nr:hypothetical protein NQ317_003870 [Molorchus minor]
MAYSIERLGNIPHSNKRGAHENIFQTRLYWLLKEMLPSGKISIPPKINLCVKIQKILRNFKRTEKEIYRLDSYSTMIGIGGSP